MNHGNQEILATVQGSTGKAFVTLPGVGTGAAQDLSGLANFPTNGVADIAENVHTAQGGDTMTFVVVDAAGNARQLICTLNGATGLEQNNPPSVACPVGWVTIPFP
ncbi:hypothetical protein [Catenulispora subtropica]|uniref:Uncharacterized protein n=1 Tax=Catenulispora subtropica TaxID=450798 RepID=A0ABN2RX83_9ACTN